MGDLTDIGPGLVAARRAAGLSQRDLGESLGVRQQQIARWEATGYLGASLANLARVAAAVGPTAAPMVAETRAAYGADPTRLAFDYRELVAVCRARRVAELAIFGSALRDDFRAESDVDVLVTYEPAARPRLSDLAALNRDLESLFGRPVDVVSRNAIERSENRIRREAILGGSSVVYAAR